MYAGWGNGHVAGDNPILTMSAKGSTRLYLVHTAMKIWEMRRWDGIQIWRDEKKEFIEIYANIPHLKYNFISLYFNLQKTKSKVIIRQQSPESLINSDGNSSITLRPVEELIHSCITLPAIQFTEIHRDLRTFYSIICIEIVLLNQPADCMWSSDLMDRLNWLVSCCLSLDWKRTSDSSRNWFQPNWRLFFRLHLLSWDGMERRMRERWMQQLFELFTWKSDRMELRKVRRDDRGWGIILNWLNKTFLFLIHKYL